MPLDRNISVKMNYFIDNFIPPFLRDSKWFMYLPLKFVFGKKSETFINFKERAYLLSDDEFVRTYEYVSDVLIQRETDLNRGCFSKILESIKGETVMEVGSGKCVLSDEIRKKGYAVTASDIILSKDVKKRFPDLTYVESNIEHMPFKDSAFDTVVCTHTLEHVRDLPAAIKELRRVCKKRLMIVVPKQRPYKYTFDLHLNFFPYPSSLLNIMANKEGSCDVIEGDLFYVEDLGS